MFTRLELPWIIDFDGTIVNRDLGALFDRWLFDNDKPGRAARGLRYLLAPANLFFRVSSRGQRYRPWSFGQSSEVINDWIEEFLDYVDDQILVNEALIRQLSSRSSNLNFLLTGCPEELVFGFLRRRNIAVFGYITGMSMKDSIRIAHHPFGKTKLKYVEGRDEFCAVGDSWTDRFLLRKAAEAIVIPRSDKLLRLAQKSDWLIAPVF